MCYTWFGKIKKTMINTVNVVCSYIALGIIANSNTRHIIVESEQTELREQPG